MICSAHPLQLNRTSSASLLQLASRRALRRSAAFIDRRKQGSHAFVQIRNMRVFSQEKNVEIEIASLFASLRLTRVESPHPGMPLQRRSDKIIKDLGNIRAQLKAGKTRSSNPRELTEEEIAHLSQQEAALIYERKRLAKERISEKINTHTSLETQKVLDKLADMAKAQKTCAADAQMFMVSDLEQNLNRDPKVTTSRLHFLFRAAGLPIPQKPRENGKKSEMSMGNDRTKTTLIRSLLLACRDEPIIREGQRFTIDLLKSWVQQSNGLLPWNSFQPAIHDDALPFINAVEAKEQEIWDRKKSRVAKKTVGGTSKRTWGEAVQAKQDWRLSRGF